LYLSSVSGVNENGYKRIGVGGVKKFTQWALTKVASEQIRFPVGGSVPFNKLTTSVKMMSVA
jgi:hypothetical protein